MTKNTNLTLQTIATILQIANLSLMFVPDEQKVIVAGIIAAGQAFLAKIGIDRNPD